MCNCNKHTAIGNYGNQVIVLPPFTNRFTCIDRCVLSEITLLWSLGIVTTGCCCGHNQLKGFIGVEDDYIEQMKAIGYAVQLNTSRPNTEDTFNLNL